MLTRRHFCASLNMKKNTAIISSLAAAGALLFTGCGESSAEGPTLSYQKAADALHMVLENDRTVYTQQVVNRLVKGEKVIKASEQFMEDKALPLPAQMFRMGAELTAEKDAFFSYSLQSLWPINKPNAATQTDVEKEGLQYIADNVGENFYSEESLGGQKYFTAIYPDIAVAPVCVTCHNEHKDSPKTDFELGDVMGGVVIRIPIDA